MQLGAEATMDTEELFVHDCSQRQGAKRFHTRIIYLFGIFVLAFNLEREIVCQMTTFVVTS